MKASPSRSTTKPSTSGGVNAGPSFLSAQPKPNYSRASATVNSLVSEYDTHAGGTNAGTSKSTNASARPSRSGGGGNPSFLSAPPQPNYSRASGTMKSLASEYESLDDDGGVNAGPSNVSARSAPSEPPRGGPSHVSTRSAPSGAPRGGPSHVSARSAPSGASRGGPSYVSAKSNPSAPVRGGPSNASDHPAAFSGLNAGQPNYSRASSTIQSLVSEYSTQSGAVSGSGYDADEEPSSTGVQKKKRNSKRRSK